MPIVIHIVLFLLSLGVIWFFAGMLIDTIDRVAKRFNKSGFIVAFFVLGFLTSISEFSVAINSVLEKQPQISAGNLIGASFVIMLFIIPLLAIVGKGISLGNIISAKKLALCLGVVLIPGFFVLDGGVSRQEGIIILLVYGTLLYYLRGSEFGANPHEHKDESIANLKHPAYTDYWKIAIGALLIFLAGHLLVNEAVYFSILLKVPSSLIGLILLSIGTNVPEMVIAARSIYKKHKDIAFGDYLGSAVANTAIFGIMAVANGQFSIEPNEFLSSFFLMLFGLILFFIFARSNKTISTKEGWALLYVYFAFFAVQSLYLIKFSDKI